MAVTENKLIRKQDGVKRSYKVNASTTIYEGSLVFLTATGYADDDTATGVNGFVGIACSKVDNSSGAAGDKSVEVWAEGDFVLTGAGTFTIANEGDLVYADDNYAIVVAIGSTSVPIGRCVKFVSATELIVSIKPCAPGALPVAALTTITHTAPGTPDYAVQNLTNSSAYGFVTQDEGNSVLSVIKNLQQRVLDLETRGPRG